MIGVLKPGQLRQRAALRDQAFAMLDAGQSQRSVAKTLGLSAGTVCRWAAERNHGVRRPTEDTVLADPAEIAERKRAAAVLAAWSRIEREELEIVGLLAGNAKLIAEKIRGRVSAGIERTAGAKGGEQDVSLRDLVGALDYTVKNWQLLKGSPTVRTEGRAEVTNRDALLDDPEYRDILKRLYRLRDRVAPDAAGPGG